MSVISAAFYTILSGDATLTGSLSTWKGKPAIFTYEPIPKEVDKPYILTVGAISDEPALDTKDSTGRRIVRDIRIYSDLTGTSANIETMAERVRTLFHRVGISVTGFKTIYVNVSGPITADEEDVYGRVISVELLLATS